MTHDEIAAEVKRIYEGFVWESMNGVVCSIPGEGLVGEQGIDTPPHRTWCRSCQKRYRGFRALVEKLDALRTPPERPTWQKIETLPGCSEGDCQPVLVWSRSLSQVLMCDEPPSAEGIARFNMTHWQPLPTPPSEDA